MWFQNGNDARVRGRRVHRDRVHAPHDVRNGNHGVHDVLLPYGNELRIYIHDVVLVLDGVDNKNMDDNNVCVRDGIHDAFRDGHKTILLNNEAFLFSPSIYISKLGVDSLRHCIRGIYNLPQTVK